MGGIARPLLNLSALNIGKMMNDAFGYKLQPPFNPYVKDTSFIQGCYLLPYVGLVGYVGTNPNLNSRASKKLVVGPLAVEAGQDAVIRTLLYQRKDELVEPYNMTISEFTNRISKLRNRLASTGVKDEGLTVPENLGAENETTNNIISADVNSLGYARTQSSIDLFGTEKTQVLCSDNDVLDLEACEHEHFVASSVSPTDLNAQFPVDTHGSVIFRGAPWKPDIGSWLLSCGSVSSAIDVEEVSLFRAFKLPLVSDGSLAADWTTVDEDVFTTNSSKHGWCNVDPEDAYSLKVKFNEECACRHDCYAGKFCELPTLCSCVNQCSGKGHCHSGSCECDSDWYGIDCSIPSALSPMREWPTWLQPKTDKFSDKLQLNSDSMSIKVVIEKKRPLIYVYDLPPEFNSHLLEGRHLKYECVNRVYNEDNRTLWTRHLYGSQMALYESILASPHRTLNGEEADYFYVPVLDSCLISRADDSPQLSLRKHRGLRSSLTLDYYKKASDHIIDRYPYWNRSLGRDHIWFFSWDEGACYAPKEIWNSMMLVHWGNTNSKHKHSTTAYFPDNWSFISPHRRGNHPCFDPEKDLVLPAWKKPDPGALFFKFWDRPRKERTILFYFNGNLGSAYGGRPQKRYSIGIRQKLAEEFGSTPNLEGKLGRQHMNNVIVTPVRSLQYHEELAKSVFCGVLPGDGWSGRMEDSILNGCIPVIIQDGIFLPYENVLNYNNFAVRIQEDEIPNLIQILQRINETEVDFMLANVQKIWQRFLYRDSILLEAQRQKKIFVKEEDWAIDYSKLEQDDALSTFIQITGNSLTTPMLLLSSDSVTGYTVKLNRQIWPGQKNIEAIVL
ncbi:hypothetical protein J5N97_010594 [Dioscorea zingiberensis]|uniref:Exostosin GT47 domain-containing protein n=1 Tax=Dioscorea zingiberensis TaxID=325984 RepID=A0A9D5HMP7_9LILI|nr:hypothetical protein J5N97_010594 [Dioscorea zingiberensis]